jgi:uncharacterized membrane protein YccC
LRREEGRSLLSWRPQLPFRDPDRASLRLAARAAIVLPAVFAFADKVIGDPQTALFAAFGSFAMLVLVDFTGSLRSQFVAYLALASAGAANVVLGTVCSQNTWLASSAMAVVGFAVLFSGAINGYFAAAGTSALLTFVLPVTIAAPLSAIPARLEGWALAAAAGICAHMLLWPARPRDTLRADAARACVALANLADSALAGDRPAIAARARSARDAVDGVRRRFLATPHRPTGPTGPTAALASLVDELDWLLSFLVSPADAPPLELCREENAEAMAAAVAVLRVSAARLDGRDERPDLARLDEAQEAVAQALAGQISELPLLRDEQALESALEPSFRVRSISDAVRQIAGYALAAAAAAPELDKPHMVRWDSAGRRARSALQATKQFLIEHASARSVWFRNSIRGAAGLALAVYIAQRTGLQHDFWIVLGTLSVLRSNALGTSSSILSALAGTAVGILVGAALVIAIGTHEPVLWAVLPVALLLAAYAPRAISFAAGQAGFTVVLFVLFNLIQPSGWEVGLVRIEDVAIGFAISLGVGLLFWPRGAAALLRDNLAAAYARSADYVAAAARQMIGGRDPARSAGAAQAAAAAVHRLDDAFRQYLAERSARRVNVESVGTLVAGAARVWRAGQSLSALSRLTDGDASLARCAANLDKEVHALRSWFIALGESLVHSTETPSPHSRDTEGRRRLLECVREAVASGDKTKLRPALVLLWASQHLDNLWRLESRLSRDAFASRSEIPGAKVVFGSVPRRSDT